MATMRVMLTGVDLSVGEVVYPPGGRLGPRWQHDVELVFVHSGYADVRVDDEPPVRIGSGFVGLLLPEHRESFAFAAGEPTRHSWLQGRADRPERLAALPRVLRASTAMAELVRAAGDAAATPLPTSAELTLARAVAALWRYAGEAQARAAGPPGAVERARAFIHAHLGEPGLDLRAIAAAAHVSPAHLVRRFRAELDTTPAAYLWERRVSVGIELLVGTGLPVGDIAARTGFRSVYHFSRRVKARTGAAPTAVRRARW
jgi:AraC-like DNA-binding protein